MRRLHWLKWAGLPAILVLLVVSSLTSRIYVAAERFPAVMCFRTPRTIADYRGPRPAIIGHRGSALQCTATGADGRCTGNTAHAIQSALDASADWIEIDIRQTKDGQLVAFHDPVLDAKTDCCGELASMNTDELQRCTVLANPPGKVLSLDEILARFDNGSIKWVLDVKSPGIRKPLLDCLERNGVAKQRAIVFGEYRILEEYRDSGMKLGYTTIFRSSFRRVVFSPEEIIQRCQALGCQLLVMPISLVTPEFSARTEAAGIEIWCFKTAAVHDMLYAVTDCGVTGLIVDNPAAAAELFSRGETLENSMLAPSLTPQPTD